MMEVNVKYDNTIGIVVQMRVSGSNGYVINKTKS